jgi:hypothetical protein
MVTDNPTSKRVTKWKKSCQGIPSKTTTDIEKHTSEARNGRNNSNIAAVSNRLSH